MLLSALDQIRRTLLWRFTPWLRPFIRDRKKRICLIASLGIGVSLLVSLSFPLWQLLLGPILLGVPHVIGDVRYLVLPNKLHQQIWFWLFIGIPFFLYLMTGMTIFATIPILLAAIQTKREKWDAYIVIFVAILFFISSILWEYHILFLLLHLHNLIGIAIWWFWSKRIYSWEYIPLFLCFIGSVLILAFSESNLFAIQYHPPGLDIVYFKASLAELVSANQQQAVVCLFAFLQSIHYLVWIRLIPEEARKQKTPRGFRKSYLALKADFGTKSLLGTGIVMLFFIGYAFFEPERARHEYLTLISFHVFLEIAMLFYQPQGSK